MDSLIPLLSSCPLSKTHPKPLKIPYHKPFSAFSNHNPSHSSFQSACSSQSHFTSTKKFPFSLQTHSRNSLQNLLFLFQPLNLAKSLLPLAVIDLFTAFPCIASETVESDAGKINLESILVAIDDFFNRYPFFVAGCTFIWLVVIPLTEEYFRKYKFIAAIDAFRKLRDDPDSQLLDIRDRKNVKFLGSPDLKILNKEVVKVEFSEGNEGGFVKKVLESFKDPSNTVLCILDSFDGNSLKAAELLFNNGFKEAYAIKGGARGEQGWMAIQDTLLPPSVHIFRRKKSKASKQLNTNGNGVIQQNTSNYDSALSSDIPVDGNQKTDNGHVKRSAESVSDAKMASVNSSSPYPNYPDMKPPSSPIPSKPQ